MQLLLRHGANPLQVNSKGQSALDVAANSEVVKLLKHEIIASSSSCSSIDDNRSPTSSDSSDSEKEEEHKVDQGMFEYKTQLTLCHDVQKTNQHAAVKMMSAPVHIFFV